MLKLKGIKKSYKTGDFNQVALDSINLEFGKKEFVSILGPSGSGKTTLLNIIGGLDRYDSGDLIINNKSTKKFKDKDWDSYRNSSVGFVFQNYNLISHITILKNVEMALTLNGMNAKKKRKKAKEALEKVGLLKHINKKPSELSGGQMQRVAIARALVNNPDIILADEPTGALDSKTSVKIMEIIKDISKDKLVIMVTHNNELALKYSSRIINLKDGKIIEDSNPIIKENNNSNFSLKRTSMSFLSALNLSLNNIYTKKGRTFLTAFASSIGIIGIALILSLSNGFNKQIEEYEKNTMSSFPIAITSVVSTLDEKTMEDNKNSFAGTYEYPKENVLFTYSNDENKKVHKNVFTTDYINYIKNINKDLLSTISYTRLINFNLLTSNNGKYNSINSSSVNFVSLPEDSNNSYLKDNYDLLYGSYPSSLTDVVLIVDNKNRIDKTLLDTLFIDFSKEKIEFNEIVGKEFKIVNNDDFYTDLGNNLFVKKDADSNLYNNKNNITIKISGIVRGKKDNKMASIMDAIAESYGSSNISKIGYQSELVSEVTLKNQESKVVKAQINSDNVVTMGHVTFDQIGLTKEEVLAYLGKDDIPSSISIYPKDFKSKDKIISYLDEYNKDKSDKDKIIYTDYAKEITSLSSNIMDAITIVLVAFSSISLVVSSLMIGIITYISVLERTKEIGILRSLGARKKDITRVFNAETLIIGTISGIIGILIARLLLIPTNIILYDLTELKNVGILNPYHALILIVVSITLTLIGGYIPAKIASKKDPVEALRSE